MPNVDTIPSGDTLRSMRRLGKRYPSAVVAAIVLFSMVTAGVASLPYSVRWFNVQDLGVGIRHAPSATPAVSEESFLADGSDFEATELGALGGAAYRLTSLLGHDDLGRSLLYRLLPGFLVSLGIGLGAALMAVIIGVLWGSVAGYLGGRVDSLMMRVVDVLYGLPYILMVILLKIALTRPLTALLGDRTRYAEVLILFIAIGGVSWLTMARVVRGQVLALRNRAFVEASRLSGAGTWHILRRHIFPNLAGPVIVYGLLVIPQAILQESFLSFLGIGVPQPIPSLGRLAADGVEAVNAFVGFWWLLVFPCATLVVTLLALNVIGDALRDAMDPKSGAASLLA